MDRWSTDRLVVVLCVVCYLSLLLVTRNKQHSIVQLHVRCFSCVMCIFSSYCSPSMYCYFPRSSIGRIRKGDVYCDSVNCFSLSWGTVSCNTRKNSPKSWMDRMLWSSWNFLFEIEVDFNVLFWNLLFSSLWIIHMETQFRGWKQRTWYHMLCGDCF